MFVSLFITTILFPICSFKEMSVESFETSQRFALQTAWKNWGIVIALNWKANKALGNMDRMKHPDMETKHVQNSKSKQYKQEKEKLKTRKRSSLNSEMEDPGQIVLPFLNPDLDIVFRFRFFQSFSGPLPRRWLTSSSFVFLLNQFF